ncbi:hypothetical protein [Aeromonas hydrophila]|uniref:hypothetical protein n=1 Tax=Aeromonas hydrophila TaxID=644 RepID=UPI0005743CCD|nr:hypothetical protein [Aeromonas hydrophila]KHN59085.1 hypothetical protein OI72_06755 [Aeromonas hydrophila]OFC47199.1 hypothetical protein BA189_08520 [Aeromonas hydrophila]OFC52918.1 hypothetical protein BA188_10730 [Aeromonas hydrophila]
MGEWSEYFDDFPEENPANWVNGQFNPQLAQEIRDHEDRLRDATNSARSEINAIVMNAWLKKKEASFLLTEDCPQCGLHELSTYKISDTFYLCECQDCGIHGKGETHSLALKSTFDAIGDGLDWRDNTINFE